MLVSSVLEKCIKTLFFHTRVVATLVWKNSVLMHLRRKFLSRQAYQDAANHVFEKRKDNCFRNYEVLRFLIKYNGITRNNIEENIKFYRVVRVIPQKNYV